MRPTTAQRFSFGFALAIVSAAIHHPNDLMKLLTHSEWETFVGSGDKSGVGVVWLGAGPVAAGSELTLEAPGGRFQLRLWPVTTPLVDDYFVALIRYPNGSRYLPRTLVRPECYYRSPPPYSAALTLCEGTRGIIASGNDYFVINPLPKRFHVEGERMPHVIVKRSLGELVPLLSLPEGLPTLQPPTGRTASYYPSEDSPVHVETAVFVDKDLYQHMSLNFPTDTEEELVRFVLTMVNAVQLLYEDPSLGRAVSFVVKRLEILHGDPEGLVRSHDIDRFLGSFCAWQREQNPPTDSNPLHWDHALILTGLDLYVISKNGKLSRQVVGLAPVAGMCTPTSSCTVNEGRHFESVYVVAHEIGHNLGMRHDGPLADNNCDPGSFLMSPTLGSGKITWSPCSKHYLDQFLHTPQSHCLMDHSNSEMHLDHNGTLPGERFDANNQCMLKYGRGSVHASSQPVNDICRDLHCTRDRHTWTSHPALEGTYCGPNKWCRSGRCVDRGLSALQAVQQAVTGGWSEWTEYSDCASSCLYGDKGTLSSGSTGVMVASRFCNNPRPENGGGTCVGSDKKYKTCPPNQCENIPRTTIQNFADEVCLRAREVDSELTGSGFQKANSNPEEACTVWCHKRGGGLKSKDWTFPDGIACQTHRKRRPMYCISGICQEFKCLKNNEEDIFLISPGMCASTLLFSRDKRRELAVGIWLPVSDCYYNCITPGRGIRLVEKHECHYCNVTASIQLCPSKIKGCDNIKTTTEQATSVCSKYREKVQHLSGFGMQLSASQEDPDRPCRLACQDETIPHRFYLVNGEDGWFPFGTDCSRGDTTKKAYCVSGKCLEFGSDDSPLHENSYILDIHSRRHRSTEVLPMKNKSMNFSIDIYNPIDVLEKDLCFINGLGHL